MPNNIAPESLAWLAEECARQLTRVLESMIGEAPLVSYSAHELEASKAEPEQFFWWEQPFNLAPDAVVWIGAGTQSWEEIGKRVLQSAGVQDEEAETLRSTYLEIVNQALSGIAGALSTRAGKEVTCLAGRQASPITSSDITGYSFEISMGELAVHTLVAFHNGLAKQPEEPAAPASAEPKMSHPGQPTETHKPNSIDLLLDVELPVSISFGRAQLALKDVIKLTTGSIVELNRAVSEPVEVIVNNCVIARGEVVVVEGNFGIRIKQVISRQERLRTLN
jgi:flagellar motor switch protein FliN